MASYAHATISAKRAAVVALEKASLEAEQVTSEVAEAHFHDGTQWATKWGSGRCWPLQAKKLSVEKDGR